MAAGGQAPQILNTGALDQQILAIVQQLDTALEACFQFNTWITGAGGGTAGLQALTAGGGRATAYSAGDATQIFNAFADLALLRNVAHNAASPTLPRDFFVNARLVGSQQLP
jgi:hypothetical protein